MKYKKQIRMQIGFVPQEIAVCEQFNVEENMIFFEKLSWKNKSRRELRKLCDFFFQAEDGIRDGHVTGVQTCALPICGEQVLVGVVGAHDDGDPPLVVHRLGRAGGEPVEGRGAVRREGHRLQPAVVELGVRSEEGRVGEVWVVWVASVGVNNNREGEET